MKHPELRFANEPRFSIANLGMNTKLFIRVQFGCLVLVQLLTISIAASILPRWLLAFTAILLTMPLLCLSRLAISDPPRPPLAQRFKVNTVNIESLEYKTPRCKRIVLDIDDDIFRQIESLKLTLGMRSSGAVIARILKDVLIEEPIPPKT